MICGNKNAQLHGCMHGQSRSQYANSESITDGWTDGPANCHTLLSYFGITNNRPFYLIDRHSCCIDSDIIERRAFLWRSCKLYCLNEETIPNRDAPSSELGSTFDSTSRRSASAPCTAELTISSAVQCSTFKPLEPVALLASW